MVPQPLQYIQISKEQRRKAFRFSKYLILAVLANGFILGSSKHYISTTPSTYTSELVFNVVGADGGVNVNLPNIGQAATSVTSGFGSKADPRENYKLLISGKTVQRNAANLLDIPLKEFGDPRPSLIANTTTIKIEMTGKSPEEAHRQVQALYKALYSRLDVLRADEQAERNISTQNSLAIAEKKLAAAQKRVSDYKLKSGFNSSDQISNLIQNIETLREKRSSIVGQRSQTNDQLVDLSRSLKMTPARAAEALTLQTDQQLTSSYSSYADVSIELDALLKSRGPNYPDAIELRKKRDTALQNSIKRATAIVGRPLAQLDLENLLLENGSSDGTPRSQLLQSIVEQSSKLKGLDGELVALQNEVKSLESRLSSLTQKEALLDQHLRQLNIAEAVFAATLTKIDLGKDDLHASYPIIQIFEDATMPVDATAPKPKLILVGAIIGAMFFTIALTLGWYRQSLLKYSRKIVQGIVE